MGVGLLGGWDGRWEGGEVRRRGDWSGGWGVWKFYYCC